MLISTPINLYTHKKQFMRIRYLLILIPLVSACVPMPEDSFEVLLENVNVINLEDGSIREDRFIGILHDTIRMVGEMSEREDFVGGRSVDLEGAYIIPGLWDMHVHFRGGDTLADENKDLLPLFLKYGVTTVRDAGGDITDHVLEWRHEIENEELAGPRIFTSGPKLDGPEPSWPGSIVVEDSAAVAPALDSLQGIGADYVKMYDGSLRPEMYYAIIAEAERRGLRSTGHMPMQANIIPAIELGLDGAEHLYYPLKACSPKADSLTAEGLGYGMLPTLIKTYDPALADSVFRVMARNDFYVTPTMYIGQTLAELARVDHSEDELLPYIGSGVQQTYQGRLESAIRAQENGNTIRADFVALTKEMLKPMHNAGVQIVAGSDCGPYNSFVYPGLSLHRELEQFVAAGLTPLQALRTATMTGPQFFGVEDAYGAVAPGKVADLIALTENPLEDIRNSRSIKAVVRGKEVYKQEKLEELLQKLLD